MHWPKNIKKSSFAFSSYSYVIFRVTFLASKKCCMRLKISKRVVKLYNFYIHFVFFCLFVVLMFFSPVVYVLAGLLYVWHGNGVEVRS